MHWLKVDVALKSNALIGAWVTTIIVLGDLAFVQPPTS